MKTYRNALLAAAAVTALSLSAVAEAGTLENLERERAIMVETLLAPNLTTEERQSKVANFKRRLVDLERMTLRDDSLKGNTSPAVRKAFESYDLTFLVHAAVEKNATVVDHWLEQLGVSTHSLMSARMGRR